MFHVKHFRVVFALHEHNSSSVLPVRVSPKAANRTVCRLCPNRACASSLRKLLADSPVESSRAGAPADTPSACMRSGFKEHISKNTRMKNPASLAAVILRKHSVCLTAAVLWIRKRGDPWDVFREAGRSRLHSRRL